MKRRNAKSSDLRKKFKNETDPEKNHWITDNCKVNMGQQRPCPGFRIKNPHLDSKLDNHLEKAFENIKGKEISKLRLSEDVFAKLNIVKYLQGEVRDLVKEMNEQLAYYESQELRNEEITLDSLKKAFKISEEWL